MAEYSTVFLHRMDAKRLGYKPLSRYICANLDCSRQIWPAAWCGLHNVRVLEVFLWLKNLVTYETR